MEEKLRHYRNTMTVTGLGIIMFGLWSAIKTVMYFALAPGLSEELRAAAGSLPDYSEDFYITFFYCFIGAVFAVDIFFRLVVGLSARSEGKGKKKGIGYVVVAVLMFISNASAVIPNLPVFFDSTGSPVDAVMTSIIELTSIFTLGELIYASVRTKLIVRKLNKTTR